MNIFSKVYGIGLIVVRVTNLKWSHFWATICRTVHPILSDRCLSCPVCLWRWCFCSQTVGWIKMSLDTEVGLAPGHILLDDDPAPLSRKRHSTPHFSAHVYCGQTAGWIRMPFGMDYGGRPRPRPHCVRWGPSSTPPPKKGKVHNFGPCLLWPNG